jgi:hypothetical protein
MDGVEVGGAVGDLDAHRSVVLRERERYWCTPVHNGIGDELAHDDAQVIASAVEMLLGNESRHVLACAA